MDTVKELSKMPPEKRAKVKWNDQRILDYISLVEKQFELPKNSLRTILYAENSGMDKDGKITPSKGNDSYTSSGVAKGLMQFTGATMKLMNGRWKHDPTDPIQNVWFAADYFKHTLEKQYKGNVVAAIADYNGGYKEAKYVLENKLPAAKETADYLKKAQYFANTFEDGNKTPAPVVADNTPAPTPTPVAAPAKGTLDNIKGGDVPAPTPVPEQKETTSFTARG